jgi:Zinc knuckle/Retrotransposon gag protein
MDAKDHFKCIRIILNNAEKSAKHIWSRKRVNSYKNKLKEHLDDLEELLRDKVLQKFFETEYRVCKLQAIKINEILGKVRIRHEEETGGESEREDEEKTGGESEKEDEEETGGESETEDEEKIGETMATYSYTEAKSLPTLAECNSATGVRDFLAAVQGYHDELADGEGGKIKLIKYVLKSKVMGAAKTRIGEGTLAGSFEELKTILTRNCGGIETLQSLEKKLKSCSQGTRTIEEFASSLEQLADKMAGMEIAGHTDQSAAAQRAVNEVYKRQALMAFTQGVSTKVRQTVIASQADTLQTAVNVAITAQTVESSSETQNAWYATSSQRQIRTAGAIKCFRCGKSGHMARDCYARLDQERYGRGQNRPNYNGQTRENPSRGYQGNRPHGNQSYQGRGYQNNRPQGHQGERENQGNQNRRPIRRGIFAAIEQSDNDHNQEEQETREVGFRQ